VKLRPRDVPRFFARDLAGATGLLIHGADPVAIMLRRDEAVRAAIGPDGEAEMRLVRLDPVALRQDPAAIQDAQRARGFFPGPRAVVIDQAGEGLAEPLAAALAGAAPGRDALIIVTAGILPPRSRLRRAFEDGPGAFALQLFDAAPDAAEIAARLAAAGLPDPDPAAVAALAAVAADIDAGSLADLITRLALYKLGDPAPLGPGDVAACAPLAVEAAVEDAVAAAAEERAAAIGPALARLAGQGVAATTLCIAAGRHFRLLHAAATDPAGPETALGRARPPVLGPRREAMLGQLRAGSPARFEAALSLLTETDLALRSGAPVPAYPLLERTLMRIALLGRAR
jgi:DNA polymerase-3 subunit delta